MTQQLLLALLSGALTSFVLGLAGAGGSMLALPLLVHVVGVRSPHVAIGVSAIAVAANALANLGLHAQRGTVKWRCATLFASSGVAGAALGATLGKRIDGDALLALFGVVMIGVGALMLRRSAGLGQAEVRLTRASAPVLVPRLAGLGFITGVASGFFGIGGGFLIAPALIWATGMTLPAAISSSLVAVSAFGATTAVAYAFSGLVNWPLAGLFIAGGLVGGFAGARLTARLTSRIHILRAIFAALVITTGVYVVIEGAFALLI